MSTITTGDDSSLVVQLKKKVDNIDQTFVIAADAEVKAQVITLSKDKPLTDVIDIDNNTIGTDLSVSKVIVQFTEQQTASIPVIGKSVLEVQVNDNGKLTWFMPIDIVKGSIP